MLRTIIVGSYISIQGIFVKDMPDGKIMVQVGSKKYTGNPAVA